MKVEISLVEAIKTVKMVWKSEEDIRQQTTEEYRGMDAKRTKEKTEVETNLGTGYNSNMRERILEDGLGIQRWMENGNTFFKCVPEDVQEL